jgi:hypothetical protein
MAELQFKLQIHSARISNRSSVAHFQQNSVLPAKFLSFEQEPLQATDFTLCPCGYISIHIQWALFMLV